MGKLVIYRNNCYDGVTAAWVAFKKFGFEGVRYIPFNYSDQPPNVKGEDVYIIDFSFKREIMKQLAYDANNLVCLDHHKTAEAALAGLSREVILDCGKDIEIEFDMNRSGAGMAWDYFFPYETRPDLVNYVEDSDLWRFKLSSSKQVNAFIQSWDIDLATWVSEVGPRLGETGTVSDLASIIREGESLLRIENKYVKSICANARLKRISDAYIGPYVETSILMSEVCDYLIKNYPGNYPFAFYSFKRKDGKIQYGLRSRSDFDVSVIAKQFGGGGHKNAAGFELDKEL